jgi:hypothetical protein
MSQSRMLRSWFLKRSDSATREQPTQDKNLSVVYGSGFELA